MNKVNAEMEKKENPTGTAAEVEPLVPIPETEQKIADLEEQIAKSKENWIRTAADFENFKKRAARERIEAAQYANATLLQKLLPILDNFEMAQAAVQNAKDEKSSSVQAGVAMIQNQLRSVLSESGLEEIDAAGKPFDPMFHEAISQQETDDVPEGNVVQQIRKGYKLRDRLLRPATVIVAKKPTEKSE